MAGNVLLLTATVTPLAGIPALARTDPKQRLEDYKLAFSFYITLLGRAFDKIIFAENSNSDISALKSLALVVPHSDKVEFISFYGLDYPAEYGRGYGEFRLIDYAVENSKLITASDVIWKVTGRYIVENISRIVDTRPPGTDLYCHMRNFPYQLCELYLLAWTNRAYQSLIKGAYSKLRNDVVPNRHTIEETLFRGLVEDSVNRLHIRPRFAVVPIVTGIRGWDNSRYSHQASLKIFARRIANYLVPSLWI